MRPKQKPSRSPIGKVEGASRVQWSRTAGRRGTTVRDVGCFGGLGRKVDRQTDRHNPCSLGRERKQLPEFLKAVSRS